MEDLLLKFANYGPTGLIAALLFYQMVKLQNKLVEIVENNTKAVQQLRDIIDKCQIVHKGE